MFFRKYLLSARAGSLVKRIAWLSMASIAVAVAAFILVLSVMSGLHANINKRILALEPHVVMEFVDKKTEAQMRSHPVVSELNRFGVTEIQLFDRQDVILRTLEGVFRGAVARGVTESTLAQMQIQLKNLGAKAQSVSTSILELPGDQEIVLGTSLARQINVVEGDFITVLPPESLLMAPGENPPFSKVRVKQIISTNIADLDSELVLYQRGKALLNFSNTGSRVTGFDLWLNDPYEATPFKEAILKRHSDLKIQTWRERNSAMFMALKLEKIMLGSFLGLSALITMFSIWSVLALLIAQKKKEMGLLMALGLSGQGLQDLFQKVGIYLAGIGLGTGTLLGTLAAIYLENHPLQVLPDIYYDNEVPAQVDFIFILFVCVVATIVIYGSVSLAMKKLSQMRPTEAFRSN